MIIDLGNGKQAVLSPGWLQIFANGGSLGAKMTAEQMQELGVAAYQIGRRMKRAKQCQSGSGS